jgi:hypothetical protein
MKTKLLIASVFIACSMDAQTIPVKFTVVERSTKYDILRERIVIAQSDSTPAALERLGRQLNDLSRDYQVSTINVFTTTWAAKQKDIESLSEADNTKWSKAFVGQFRKRGATECNFQYDASSRAPRLSWPKSTSGTNWPKALRNSEIESVPWA